ncbi:hypothetical protein MMC26_000801 [Xylographa opegraphella]|nr:hypothetical protein [Xylographa opegraphella]
MTAFLPHSVPPFHLPPSYRLARDDPRFVQPTRTNYTLAEENYHQERKEAELRARQEPNTKLVSQWLAGTEEVPLRGRRLSSPVMNGAAVNSMLAPIYGGLYNGQAVTNHTTNLGRTTVSGSKAPVTTARHNPGSSSQASSPVNNGPTQSNTTRRRSSGGDNQIVSYLQIPSSINDSKGSLAEFAAQITCLFWFESSFTLHRVEESKITPTPTTPLVLEALPTIGFRKWVTTILSTTQVTQNVILLALMFIYRLKKLNPTVKGKPGSEFRLLTVALMLGNKFLDDNTYTNKTWAEVSGISVQEIHIMEVEFLSNMRYTLYVSDLEWALWHRKLGRFWDYFDKASKTAVEIQRPTQNLNLPMLPSPPLSLQASPPFVTGRYANSFMFPNPASFPPMPIQLAPTLPLPNWDNFRMHEGDSRSNGRKRSYDDLGQGPTAKRARSINSADVPSLTNSSTPSNYVTPRLPVPNLSISTSGHLGMYPGSYSAQLPVPTGRAMSTLYPVGPQYSSNPLAPLQSAASSSTLPPMNEQLRKPQDFGSRTTSPTVAGLMQNSQDLLSPSGYPSQRSSPYKPLRSVNTLLVPPPSASLHNPSQRLGSNNMHYQPLGKPLSERKTGVVPYTQQEPWHQVPQTSQWPLLPQPCLTPSNLRL